MSVMAEVTAEVSGKVAAALEVIPVMAARVDLPTVTAALVVLVVVVVVVVQEMEVLVTKAGLAVVSVFLGLEALVLDHLVGLGAVQVLEAQRAKMALFNAVPALVATVGLMAAVGVLVGVALIQIRGARVQAVPSASSTPARRAHSHRLIQGTYNASV